MRHAQLLTAVLAGLLALAGCTGTTEQQETGPVRVEYGSAPEQFGDLSVPEGAAPDEPRPAVVLIHGGFWQDAYELGLMEPLAADLAGRGYVVWNIEYRKVGEPGGGYPGTMEDVAAAVDHLAVLAEEHPIDLEQVAVVGHSAGGHLSLWSGTREDPAVQPALVVGQAPVADLAAAAGADLGGTAVTDFMGAAPNQDPEAYAAASPAQRLPGNAPQLIVQGGVDTIVPPAYVAGYVEQAQEAGAEIEYVVSESADHFAVISPEHASWDAVVERLPSVE
ncbi:alpha/beta hydrolase [Ruania suaedae]|uniref:alpha/beta hydrolase n=1 Tax=Ruania suaedae TaxID=2897774 RepID=UPI001E41018D|nr:alpha/beta hydrolase [Ruania suaedae]UFU01828.1 alpha/beta hydrolase [Ruania suaedae]